MPTATPCMKLSCKTPNATWCSPTAGSSRSVDRSKQLERQQQDASGARRALATAERTLKMRAEHRERLRHDLGLSGG